MSRVKADAPQQTTMAPVIGLRHDRIKNPFEPLPTSLTVLCANYLADEHGAEHMYIYAHASDGQHDRYIVNGYTTSNDPKNISID